MGITRACPRDPGRPFRPGAGGAGALYVGGADVTCICLAQRRGMNTSELHAFQERWWQEWVGRRRVAFALRSGLSAAWDAGAWSLVAFWLAQDQPRVPRARPTGSASCGCLQVQCSIPLFGEFVRPPCMRTTYYCLPTVVAVGSCMYPSGSCPFLLMDADNHACMNA